MREREVTRVEEEECVSSLYLLLSSDQSILVISREGE